VIEERLIENLLTWICSKFSRILLCPHWRGWTSMGRHIYVPKPPKKRDDPISKSKTIAHAVFSHLHTSKDSISAAFSRSSSVCLSSIPISPTSASKPQFQGNKLSASPAPVNHDESPMKSTTTVPPGSEAARKSRSAPRKFSVK